MPNPSATPEDCVETVRDSKPKVEESGRKAVFLNPERASIKKVKVDGCLITSDSLRADYIVSKPGVIDVIVELKGKDIYHARDQILATMPVWRAHPSFSTKLAGLIICTRSPLSASELQLMKAKALLHHRLWLEVDENGKKEYNFSNFGPDL
jgi:hypothetical protein